MILRAEKRRQRVGKPLLEHAQGRVGSERPGSEWRARWGWSDDVSKYQASFRSKRFVYVPIESFSKTRWHRSWLAFCCGCHCSFVCFGFWRGKRVCFSASLLQLPFSALLKTKRQSQERHQNQEGKKEGRKEPGRHLRLTISTPNSPGREWSAIPERDREVRSIPIRSKCLTEKQSLSCGPLHFSSEPLMPWIPAKMQQVPPHQRKRKSCLLATGQKCLGMHFSTKDRPHTWAYPLSSEVFRPVSIWFMSFSLLKRKWSWTIFDDIHLPSFLGHLSPPSDTAFSTSVLSLTRFSPHLPRHSLGGKRQ